MTALAEIFRYLAIVFFRRRPSEPPLPSDQTSPEVFISLTTTPERIKGIRPALLSVLDQTVAPAKVLLHIPQTDRSGNKYQLPEWLSNFAQVEVVRVEEDLGPATKWFYLAQQKKISAESLVIVLDDDQVYPRQMVAHYLKCRQMFPGASFTLLGWKVPDSLRHRDRKVCASAKIKIFARKQVVRYPQRVDCVQGASSYMITTKMLQFSRTWFEQHHAAYYADDILISGLLASQKTEIWVLPAPFSFARLHAASFLRGNSLFRNVNKNASHNDDLYRLFQAHWLMANR